MMPGCYCTATGLKKIMTKHFLLELITSDGEAPSVAVHNIQLSAVNNMKLMSQTSEVRKFHLIYELFYSNSPIYFQFL